MSPLAFACRTHYNDNNTSFYNLLHVNINQSEFHIELQFHAIG